MPFPPRRIISWCKIQNGARLKGWAGSNVGYGFIQNITFKNFYNYNVDWPIVLDACYFNVNEVRSPILAISPEHQNWQCNLLDHLRRIPIARWYDWHSLPELHRVQFRSERSKGCQARLLPKCGLQQHHPRWHRAHESRWKPTCYNLWWYRRKYRCRLLAC